MSLAGSCALTAAVQAAPKAEGAPAVTPSPSGKPLEEADFTYTVKAGDNPWSLTNRYLLGLSHWQRLVAYNRIADDRRIAPGTVLRIPVAWLKFTSTSVRLASASGAVEVDTGKGWSPATPGTELRQGHRLRTRKGSALLLLADGSTLRVRADSELILASAGSLVANGALWLCIDLVRGHLESEAHELRKSGGRFDVRTPAAITSVRGTVFRVSADGEQARTEVVDGRVDVHNRQGTVSVATASGIVASRDRAPQAPRALLAPPPLPASVDTASHAPLDLGRPMLAGAVAFRTQVFSSAEKTATLLHESVAEGVAMPALPEGRYVLHVRGIDSVGLEGLSSQRTVQVQVQVQTLPPTPPAQPPELPPVPTWTSVDTGRDLQLAWTRLGTARLYQVQVRLDNGDASAVVLDDYVAATTLTLPVPLPGSYRVRVRLAPELGREPAWSEDRRIDGRPAVGRGWSGWLSGAR